LLAPCRYEANGATQGKQHANLPPTQGAQAAASDQKVPLLSQVAQAAAAGEVITADAGEYQGLVQIVEKRAGMQQA